jgi:PAS domain S-box-containing protein
MVDVGVDMEFAVESASVVCSGVCEKNRIRVLHVDDDAGFLAVAKQCLEEAGYFEVETATSAEEALAKLKMLEFDAIVADYQMPGMNGLELLRELRRRGNEAPFFLFTSRGKDEIAVEALNSGVERYVDKQGSASSTYDELKRSICGAIKNRRAGKLLRESEERLKLITENMQDVLILTDGNFTCTYVSSSIKWVLGFEPSNVIGKPIYELVHPDDLPMMMNAIEKAVDSRFEGKIEVRCRRSDGNYAVVEGRGKILTDGNGHFTSAIVTVSDVTERKKTQQALATSEEKYRSLFVNMLNGFAYCQMIWDKNGEPEDFVYLEVNDAFENLTGLKKADILGKKVTSAIPGIKEANPELFEIYGRVALTGKKECFEIYFQPLDIWLSISVYSPKRNYFAAVFDNITERKKAEQRVSASEDKYRRLFEDALDAIFVADAETGIIVDCNRAATELTGWSKTDLVGRHQRSLHPPEDTIGDFSRSFIQHRDNKGGFAVEERLITKTGEIKDVAIKATYLAINGRRMLQGTFRDMSERNKDIERIRFQADLLNAVGQAVIATDTKGNITYWNRAAEQLYGWLESEVLGRNIVDVTPAETSYEQATKIMNRLVAGKSWSGEFTAKRHDGLLFQAIVTDAPIIDEKGECVGIVGVSTDITEQKWMQEIFNEAIAKVADLNEKLQVVESLTRHDIRNKLAALNGGVFLLKKRLAQNEDAMSHLNTLELLSQQILRLLEFERIYVQVGAEELTSVSVEKSLAEAASLFSDLKSVELVNDCRGLMVQADSLLRQLFYNLIDNSLRYGEKISKITVRTEEEENLLKLIYEDNGVGLSEEIRGNLFKEGFGKNTGFGLYLIKRICEAYGWTIQETGKQGKGAQFTMTIPKTGKNGKTNYHFG